MLKQLDERRLLLNEQIKRDLASHAKVTSNEDVSYYSQDGLVVNLKVRRSRSEVDQFLLTELLHEKGLWDECKREVPDESLVEQAYIEGKLTDKDLREIRKEQKPQLALTVDYPDLPVEEEAETVDV